MSFLGNTLNNLLSKVPIFKDKDGTKLEIKIEFRVDSIVCIFINVRDKSNYPIKLQNLDRSQIDFFLQGYRNFIIDGKYNKSKSVIGRIQSSIQTSMMLLKNKRVTQFHLSLYNNLPLSPMINKIYTIDEFDDKCIILTKIENGKMWNIIDPNVLYRVIPSLHNLSLRMLYDLNLKENAYYAHIFGKMKLYLRIIVPTIISIATINNFINNLHSNHLELLIIYIFTLIISLFPHIIYKIIINLFICYFIKKNPSIYFIEKIISYFKKNVWKRKIHF
jgi:hypothetical protein